MTGKTTNINLIIGVILSLVFVLLSFSCPPFLEKFELGIYDLGSRLAHNENLSPDSVVLVEIDDNSIDELGSWPWPRRIIGSMVDILKKNGARTIGLNIPLDEAERTEGLDEIRKFHEKYDAYPAASGDPSLKKWVLDNLARIEDEIDNDPDLTDSIRNAGNVILPVYAPYSANPGKDRPADESILSKSMLKAAALSSRLKGSISKDRLLIPIAEFGKNSAGVGFTADASEGSGRSYPAYITYNNAVLPSFRLKHWR